MRNTHLGKAKATLAVATAVSLTACCIGTSYGNPGDGVADLSLSAIIATHTLYAADDFDGPRNSAPNPRLWNIETGGVGWGGNEIQAYTGDPANVRLDGAGNLVIEANTKNGHVASARVNTQAKVDLTNGLVAARIQMPAGQGLHPAFWMLGESIGDVGWPASGEIDIVELMNSGSTAYFTAIGPPVDDQQESHSQVQTTFTTSGLANNFHTYWLYKQPQLLVFGIDSSAVATITPADLSIGAHWIFDAPFFAVLNLAVGGEWPGPLGDGVLPKQMTVDWVRFYR
ncbi:glycoside hydrolase family 16 protein [soil metagenome]